MFPPRWSTQILKPRTRWVYMSYPDIEGSGHIVIYLFRDLSVYNRLIGLWWYSLWGSNYKLMIWTSTREWPWFGIVDVKRVANTRLCRWPRISSFTCLNLRFSLRTSRPRDKLVRFWFWTLRSCLEGGHSPPFLKIVVKRFTSIQLRLFYDCLQAPVIG